MDDEYYDQKYIDYYQSKIDNDKTEMNNIHNEIDNQKYYKSSSMYPIYNEDDFIYRISNRLEFFHLKSLFNITEINNNCPQKSIEMAKPLLEDYSFELSNNQQFLKNFINKKTPYRGIVIFHGVGVGKTCSAINISSSFRDLYLSSNEKIICLVPKNIRGGWEKTIYDKTKGSEQCSGDSFEDIINNEDNKFITNRKVSSMIKNYYDFYGYLKFANHVKSLIKNGIGNLKLSKTEYEEKEREIIRKNFSNRVLIIDELHNLRDDNDENKKNELPPKIKKGEQVLWEDKRGVSRYGKVEGMNSDYYLIRRDDNDVLEEVNTKYIQPIGDEGEKSRVMIEKVIKYSEGLRLIMLSATPMFNKSTEIIWLLNLLLKNDNRPTIAYKDVFRKNFKTKEDKLIIPEGARIIKDKCTGYFSYLRGENPISFPIRFYPDINKDTLCMGGNYDKKTTYLNYPSKSLFLNNDKKHIAITDRYQFRYMKMYNTVMVNNQLNIYNLLIQDIQKNRKSKKSLRLSDRNIGLQISNIVYSNNSKSSSYKGKYGQKGYDSIFKDRTIKKSKSCSYIDINNPILDFDRLKDYSCKMYTIIDNMLKKKPKGIIFIYSDFIYSGVLPLAIALEHIGFEKYNGKNILNYPEWKKGSDGKSTKKEPIDYQLNKMGSNTSKSRAKYIILTGDKSLSPDNEMERLASSNENNSEGQNIKIILGNTVASEGMDFKNIREKHILDPWYHLYKIEQIIGRGIRYCSHSLQSKEHQNVTVYLHTSSIDPEIESIDTNTYRIAEEKASQIGEIEKIIKENAIDCFLNKQINVIKHLDKINMKTSYGENVIVDINDKDFTKICSFSGDKSDKSGNKGCDINCNISEDKIDQLIKSFDNDELINDATFTIEDINISIQIIYKIIVELYDNFNCYTLIEITENIKNVLDTNYKIIYHALNEIINNKWIIWFKNNPGYIHRINNYYLYQPSFNNDLFIPYIHRTYSYKEKNKSIPFNIDLHINIEDESTYNCILNYNDIYEKIRKDINSLDKTMGEYEPYLSTINEDLFIDHIIDSLTYIEKKVVLEEVICEYINNDYNELIDPIDSIILKFFNNNLISKDNDDNYHILDQSQGEIIGFFLYNTSKYYSNIDKDVLDDYTYFIYDKNKWSELDSVGIYSIKNNFKKNKSKGAFFKTDTIWGYSFKDSDNTHMFKIIDNPTYDNKIPGKVIGNKGVKPISLLKDFSINFKDNFKLYIKQLIQLIESNLKDKTDSSTSYQEQLKGLDINSIIKKLLNDYRKNEVNESSSIISKEFITLLFEYSLRSTYSYFNYDIFLLKYIS